MEQIGKQIIDNVLRNKESLENLCKYTYTYYGVWPFASWFAKERKSKLYISLLWELFELQKDEEISIGAFLILAESAEEHPPVPIEFAQRALNIWCKQNFKDDKVLEYVFNRFPKNRKDWILILKNYDRLNGKVLSKWGDSLDIILHLFLTMIEGEMSCKIEQIDLFLTPKLDASLHLITKQVIGLVNNSDDISCHFINELLAAILKKDLKLSTRMLVFQILTMKKIEEQAGSSNIVNLFFNASINTPSPLGSLLYNVARQMNKFNQNNQIQLKLVARSNRYMNDAYGDIKLHVWHEILYAFHTEIKHSLKELQYSKDFTNEMIVKDLLYKTKLQSPFDPFELCRELNILVKQVELPGDIEAFTIKSEFADKGMIVLNHKYGSVKRQKFTLAHEICHFLKHSFPNEANVLVDEKVEVMISEANEMVQYVNPEWERDANDFANRLLLPTGSIEEMKLKRIQYNLVNNILSLSEKWEVSMSVLASKMVSVTQMELILIISENGEIVFSKTSPYWEGEKISLYNENVPSDSHTYDFIHSQRFAHSTKPHVTNLKIWHEELPNITMKEEVFATGYGKVYTFLYK